MPVEQSDIEMSDPDLPGLNPEISSDESASEDDWRPASAYRPQSDRFDTPDASDDSEDELPKRAPGVCQSV